MNQCCQLSAYKFLESLNFRIFKKTQALIKVLKKCFCMSSEWLKCQLTLLIRIIQVPVYRDWLMWQGGIVYSKLTHLWLTFITYQYHWMFNCFVGYEAIIYRYFLSQNKENNTLFVKVRNELMDGFSLYSGQKLTNKMVCFQARLSLLAKDNQNKFR